MARLPIGLSIASPVNYDLKTQLVYSLYFVYDPIRIVHRRG